MSQQTIGFKISIDQKNDIENFISEYMKLKGTETKGNSLYEIIMKYKTIFFDRTSDENIDYYRLKEIGCQYLHRMDINYYCTEKTHRTKQPELLGEDPEKILILCDSCKKGKLDESIKEENKLFNRDQKVKLLNLRRLLIRITKSGFQADVFICTNKVDEDSLFGFSKDGERLNCANAKNELVYIKDVCMNVINTETGNTPCMFLVKEQHLVRIDIRKQDESQKLHKELEDQSEDEKKKIIDAEYKVKEVE